MRRWERRLKDLALALEASGLNYFEPELFRLNSNHFLTTARTVSFLFQKDKENIPEFASWHLQNIVTPWKDDRIMKWSIASRNTIEKEGDLDLNSSVSVRLIIGYIEEHDIPLRLDNDSCLHVGIKRLIRFSRSQLPTGVSDSSVIKIEREWIANTLSECELLQALRYIYARMYEACRSLAIHLGTNLDSTIPDPASFDDACTGCRHVTYVKLNDCSLGSLKTRRIPIDKTIECPEWVSALRNKRLNSPPNSLEALVNIQSEAAEQVFLRDGYHIAMAWLFDDNFQIIDYMVIAPTDQADKYIFWRSLPDKIHYLRAKYLVWTAEAWIRGQFDPRMTKATRNLPITGEILQVVGIDGHGNSFETTWTIERGSDDSKPRLKPKSSSSGPITVQANYLIPAIRALKHVVSSG